MENENKNENIDIQSAVDAINERKVEAKAEAKASVEAKGDKPIETRAKEILEGGQYPLERDFNLKIFRKNAFSSKISVVNSIGNEMRADDEFSLKVLVEPEIYRKAMITIRHNVLHQAARDIGIADYADRESAIQTEEDESGRAKYFDVEMFKAFKNRSAAIMHSEEVISDKDIYAEGAFYFRDDEKGTGRWVINRVGYPLHDINFNEIKISEVPYIFANRDNIQRNRNLKQALTDSMVPPAKTMGNIEKFIINNHRLNNVASYNGRLLAGMIVSAIFSGYHRNPSQRTQIQLTGGSGEGKSWITRLMVAISGTMAESTRGTNSEARVRVRCCQSKLFVVDDGNASSHASGAMMSPKDRGEILKKCYDGDDDSRRDMEAGTKGEVFYPMRATTMFVGTDINFGDQRVECDLRSIEFSVKKEDGDDDSGEVKIQLDTAITECKRESEQFINWTFQQGDKWIRNFKDIVKLINAHPQKTKLNERKPTNFACAAAGYCVLREKTADEMRDELNDMYVDYLKHEENQGAMAERYQKIITTPHDLFNETESKLDAGGSKGSQQRRLVTLENLINLNHLTESENIDHDKKLKVYEAMAKNGIYLARDIPTGDENVKLGLFMKNQSIAATTIKDACNLDGTSLFSNLKMNGWKEFVPPAKKCTRILLEGKIQIEHNYFYAKGFYLELDEDAIKEAKKSPPKTDAEKKTEEEALKKANAGTSQEAPNVKGRDDDDVPF